jgi:hypothetical protein
MPKQIEMVSLSEPGPFSTVGTVWHLVPGGVLPMLAANLVACSLPHNGWSDLGQAAIAHPRCRDTPGAPASRPRRGRLPGDRPSGRASGFGSWTLNLGVVWSFSGADHAGKCIKNGRGGGDGHRWRFFMQQVACHAGKCIKNGRGGGDGHRWRFFMQRVACHAGKCIKNGRGRRRWSGRLAHHFATAWDPRRRTKEAENRPAGEAEPPSIGGDEQCAGLTALQQGHPCPARAPNG